MNERICATALYYLDSENITPSYLSYRMQTPENIHEEFEDVGQVRNYQNTPHSFSSIRDRTNHGLFRSLYSYRNGETTDHLLRKVCILVVGACVRYQTRYGAESLSAELRQRRDAPGPLACFPECLVSNNTVDLRAHHTLRAPLGLLS